MYIDLNKKQLSVILPLINAKAKQIRRKVLKEKKDDWADCDEIGIESKLRDFSEEYYHLKRALAVIETAETASKS